MNHWRMSMFQPRLQEEIKLIHTLLKPKYFMPIHGNTGI